MTIEDVWMKNLVRLVESLGHGDKRRGYREVAETAGLSEEYVYQLVEGKPNKDGERRVVGKRAAKKIAVAFAGGRPLEWFDIDQLSAPDGPASSKGQVLQQRPTSAKAVSTAPSASAASAEMSLGQTLARLGQELGRASPQTRAAVADLLSRYAQNPAQGQSLAQAIEMLVQSDIEKKAN